MKTIKAPITNTIIIEKSKFICSIKRVKSEQEATEFIGKIKKEHWSANHNCSAFIIGKHSEIMRSSDNGEPSGTAGAPMLDSLKKNNLSDIVAVVTRYFGGIKLGAGGLIRAYSKSVSEAIKQATIIESVLMNEVLIKVSYPVANIIDNKTSNYLCFKKDYSQEVCFTFYVKPSEQDKFIHLITELTNAHFTSQILRQINYDLEIN
ncbi:YigZ family protein [Mycoplasmatota bacterium zrk1]